MKKSLRMASAYLKHPFLILLFLLSSIAVFSQAISGTVSDADNRPVSKVTVQVKGKTRTTLTNDEGKFSISATGNDVLVFTYVGLAPQEVEIKGQRTINITMNTDVRNMEGVVVTALGLKREARKLGYSAETVKVSELQQNRTTNIMASLEGKIAGLDISPPSAGAGASTKIRLRGQSSFAGATNSPLLVVNGLPMSQGANGANGNDSRDNGDNLLLFNPDDVESMTVLKGATAAALYGSRAANGAIVITTKTGAKNTGIGVEYTANYSSDEVLDYTNYQYEFGQGQGLAVNGVTTGVRPRNVGEAVNTAQFGWGERYDGASTIQFDGESRPYTPEKNRLKKFFQTGTSLTNTIAVSGGNARGNFRASFSNLESKGITPGNTYQRKIFNLGVNQNLNDKLSVQVNMNYTNDQSQNPPQVGVQGQGYMNFVVRMSPTTPLSVFEQKAVNSFGAETTTNGFGTTVLNPYFYIPRQFYKNNNDRLLGTVSAKYQFAKWLYLQGRVNMNYNRSFNEQNNPTGAGSYGTSNNGIYYDNTRTTYNGSYNVSEGSSKDMNYDFILGGNHNFGDLSLDAFVGGNSQITINRNVNATSTGFVVRDVYSIGNGTVFTQGYTYSKTQINSLYGQVSLGYKNMLFVDGTIRQDWFSILNPSSNTYTYPSVSGSFVFSELLKEKLSWLEYGKLRGSWADVGSANGPGLTYAYGNLSYGFNTQQYLGRTVGNINQTDAPNAFLRPFSVKEKEIGLELKMLRSRLNLDLSVYDKRTTDQIMPAQVSSSSGYNNTLLNIGSLQNRGAEVMLEVVPFRTRGFSWSSSFNTAYNTSKVLSMGPGITRYIVADWYNGGASNEFIGKLVYEVGKPLNQIAAKTYLRDNNGQILVNGTAGSSKGQLLASATDVLFGSALPKFTGGWNNTFRYKNLSLLVHFDYKTGGYMLSGSALNSLRQGHSQASLVGRRPGETGVILPGIYASGTDAGKTNSTPVFGQQFYANYRTLQIADPFIYKSDYIKLRNITLTYDFSKLVSSNVKFVKGLTLSAACRNVAILKKYVPDVDPEAVASSGDFRTGYEAVSLPTTRNYSLNLNVKF
ncbi:MAG: SusC/RagA family TonB-linked outer membrane protein [Williamsia sp.]|nr:SusC/RagA family TonB-linked outer membrane protein [Williamsia sp.]